MKIRWTKKHCPSRWQKHWKRYLINEQELIIPWHQDWNERNTPADIQATLAEMEIDEIFKPTVLLLQEQLFNRFSQCQSLFSQFWSNFLNFCRKNENNFEICAELDHLISQCKIAF